MYFCLVFLKKNNKHISLPRCYLKHTLRSESATHTSSATLVTRWRPALQGTKCSSLGLGSSVQQTQSVLAAKGALSKSAAMRCAWTVVLLISVVLLSQKSWAFDCAESFSSRCWVELCVLKKSFPGTRPTRFLSHMLSHRSQVHAWGFVGPAF